MKSGILEGDYGDYLSNDNVYTNKKDVVCIVYRVFTVE